MSTETSKASLSLFDLNMPPACGIVLGLCIYELGDFMLCVAPGIHSSAIFRTAGIATVILFSLKIKRNHKYDIKGLLGLGILLFMIWNLIMLGRGTLSGNLPVNCNSFPQTIRHWILYPYSGVAFLFPLAIFIPFERNEFPYYMKIGKVLSIFSLFVFAIYYQQLFFNIDSSQKFIFESRIGKEITFREFIASIIPGYGLVFFVAWLFMFLPKSTYLWPLIYVFSVVVVCIRGGGRGSTVSLILLALIWFYIFQHKDSSKRLVLQKKLSTIIFLVCFGVLLYNLIFNTSVGELLRKRVFTNEDYVELRESNRTGIRNDFEKDFNETPFDWIIGRGINGSYYSRSIESDDVNWDRGTIEYGYLYLILKGGVVELALYIFVLLYASFLGFKSNNLLCKAMAFFVVFQVYELIPFGLPKISIIFFLTWRFVPLLASERFRKIDNTLVKRILNDPQFSFDSDLSTDIGRQKSELSETKTI